MKRLILLSVMVSLMALFATSGTLAQQRTHTVTPGDTLGSIADFYDSSVEAIAAANGIINPNRISIGQQLIIPAPGTNVNASVGSYTVQPGDRLIDIATRYNTTVEALQQTNGITNGDFISPGQTLNLPATGGPVIAPGAAVPATPIRTVVNGSYTVQAGDTLFSISRSFNIDIYTIANANGLLNLNRILVGQSLVIPGY